MAVTVRIPATLRKVTNGEAELSVSGGTVADVLGQARQIHPDLGNKIFGDDGKLRRFVNIYVGGEDIRFLNGLETPVHEGSDLSIIPAVAGGCCDWLNVL